MSACLKVIFALFLVWRSCEGQRYVPGEPVNAPVQLRALLTRAVGNDDPTDPGPPSTDCVNVFGPVCGSCHTLLTCANAVINKQTCSSIDPAKPYCSGKVCTADFAGTCEMPFRCTSTGIFPNPSDCNSYYFCTSATPEGSLMYKCPTNYAFDSKTGMCKQKKTTADCVQVSCTGKENQYQILPSDKSIMAYCANTPDLKETILFRCPDYENMEYDAATYECKFVCKGEGRFEDRKDCKKFYECYRSGTILLFDHVTCPPTFSYKPDVKGCVPGTCDPALP